MKNGKRPVSVCLLIFAMAGGATPLAAQQEVVLAQMITTPHFFIAVIGGVILAIGFQILLTSLSVASGISLIGDVEEKSEKRARERRERRRREMEREPREEREHAQATVYAREAREEFGRPRAEVVEEEEDEGTAPIVKLSSAIGVWTLITVSISLFFASLLAVRLTLIGTVWMGVTLGLIIWAAFFAIMTYLEIRSASTLIGGVFSAALSGLRGSFAAAKGVFAASPEEKIAKAGAETVTALREELAGAFDLDQIGAKLDEYVERLKPQPVDFDRIKADLTEILKNIQFEEHAEITEGRLDRQTFIKLAMEQPHFKKEDAERLGDMFEEIRSTVGKEGRPSEKVEEVVEKMAGKKGADVAKYEARIEEYLRQTGREELDPEKIKQDIDRIFEDPKATREILLNRINSIDRSTLVSLIEQRDDMSHEKAEQLVSKVEQGIQFVKEKVLKMESGAGEARAEAEGALRETATKAKLLPGKLEDRLRHYLGSIGRPEFDYDRLRLDFERMFHDPKASLKILRARMKLYDRDSLIALLSSREGMTEADAEKAVRAVEHARDNVLRRAEIVESEIRDRLRQAKQLALHEAESVRKASATAAWWMVGTAVVSGAFSALGAVIAITW